MSVFLIAMLIFLVDIASDMYLPSLVLLPEYFGASIASVQLTISAYLIGLTGCTLFYGVFADMYGRKPVILAGTALFTASTLMCYLSEDLYLFIFSRVMQGIGGGVGMSLGYACIADLYSGVKCSQMISRIGMIIALSPAIGPIIGGWIASVYGWKMIFLIMFFASIILFVGFTTLFKETIGHIPGCPSFFGSFRSYLEVFRTRGFLLRCSFIAFTFASLWAEIAYTPLVFESIGIHYDSYGIYVAIMVVSYILGTIISQAIIPKIGMEITAMIGAMMIASGDILVILRIDDNSLSTAILTASWSWGAVGLGMVLGNAVSGALNTLSKTLNAKGSAVIVAIEMLSAGLGIQICAEIAGPNLKIAVLIIMVFSITSIINCLVILGKKENRLMQNQNQSS